MAMLAVKVTLGRLTLAPQRHAAANLEKQENRIKRKNRKSLIINEFAILRKYILGGHRMKILEILMFNEEDLAEGSAGLIGADLIRPVLDQIRPSNPVIGRREPLAHGTP